MGGVSRVAKLRAMSAREIKARLAYKGYLTYERALHRSRRLAGPRRVERALGPSAVRGVGSHDAKAASHPRFFPSLESPEKLRACFDAHYQGELNRSRQVADAVAAGQLEFFGRQFSLPKDIDWHADPVTGSSWPRLFHADVPVHGGNIGFGDVKHVWEINRHQFFVDLAKVAFLDRSEVHAGALHRLLRSWLKDVPYATGAPWACALEPAFRAWSWLWAYHLVRASGLLDDETHRLWRTGLFDHARFLHRHLEIYSSPYNHLIGEAAALFALGLVLPEFREAAAWAQRGQDVLESTVAAQFHRDGGTVEQSAFYHHATLGFYLLAAILGRRNGRELSAEVWAAIERGVGFSAALVQPDGRMPRFGGADDGKPIRLEHLPFWDFRPYQAIGAVLFARRDFAFVAGRFWEDALWLLGPEGLATFEALDAQPPATSAALPASGYFVARSSWAAEADYLCFDCGDQAAGLRRDAVPSAAHGHADCLSVVVGLGGREVLVDPGFFCYNGDPKWEVHFRKTRAHNTIVVDGRDQAQHVSKMAWTHTYSARQEGWEPHALAWVRGSHDGYQRLSPGVTHQRTAWLRPDGYVVIRDELISGGHHAAEAVFQFAPGKLSLGEATVLFDDRFELCWVGSVPVTAEVVCGGDEPEDGWIATSLGVRAVAPRLTLRMATQPPRVVLLSILSDRRRGAGDRRTVTRNLRAEGVLCASVPRGTLVDEIIVGVDGPAARAGVGTDAPMVILRLDDGRLVDVQQAGGSRVAVDEGAWSQNPNPALATSEPARR
jgi:hypothetical protein